MQDVKKYIIQGICALAFAGLTWAISTVWDTTNKNTYYSIEHNKDITSLSARVDKLEQRQNVLPEIYVTRRELNIILSNIEGKVDSVSGEMKNINGKLDKVVEKLYDKK